VGWATAPSSVGACLRGIVRRQHRSAKVIARVRLMDAAVPRKEGIHLILDPVRLPYATEVAVYIALRLWRFRFHWRPLHASWLSVIEALFAILSKKCLTRSELVDCATFDQHGQ
jgi:transposase